MKQFADGVRNILAIWLLSTTFVAAILAIAGMTYTSARHHLLNTVDSNKQFKDNTVGGRDE